MWIIITFMLKLIIQIAAATIKNNIYHKIMNERAMLEIMKETDARNAMECAAHCTITDGCRSAQWRASGCELLSDTELGEHIELCHEEETIYMCMLLSLQWIYIYLNTLYTQSLL